MERRQLEYFVAIVEHGGFTHAAKALRVAQPSLSRAIAKLEHELDVELFHRVGRNAVLSSAGQLMADRARLVLRDLDAMRAAARAVGDGLVGRVDVAATSSSALEPVISIIAELRERHPGVLVSTSSALSAAEVVAMVLQGRCEAGVCGSAERPSGQGLVAHHLRDEEFLLVAPPGTRLGRGGGFGGARGSGGGAESHLTGGGSGSGGAGGVGVISGVGVADRTDEASGANLVGGASDANLASDANGPGEVNESDGAGDISGVSGPYGAGDTGGVGGAGGADGINRVGGVGGITGVDGASGAAGIRVSGDTAASGRATGVGEPGSSDGTVEWEDLKGMRFVVTKPATAVRALFDRLAASVGEVSIAAEVGDRSVVLPMVLRGIGAGLMPDGWADLARRAGAEVYRFSPPERLPQWLVHRSGPITAATQAFLDTTLARPA